MPDLGTQIATARQAGYSDADITDYLAKDPGMGPKVAQAKSAGYSDAEIADHLTSSAPAPKENVFQKAARLTGEEFGAASDAYKHDVQTAIQTHSPLDQAKPVLDAARAAFSPIKGIADATFGDKPVALPFGINSKGLTGGDIATFAIPVAGELKAAASTGQFAKDAGITARTAEQTLASSKAAQAPVSIARPNPAPTNDLAAKVQQFDQAGVRPTLAAMGPGNGRVAKAVAENPLAGVRVRANLQGSLDDTSAAVDRAANSFGVPATRGAAGEAVQQGVQGFNQRFSQRADALYTPVFDKIDAAHAAAAQKAQQEFSLAKVDSADTAENSNAAAQLDYRNRQAQAAYSQTQASRDAQDAAALKSAKGGAPAEGVEPPAQYVWPPEKPVTPPPPSKAPVIQPEATKGVLAQINARGDSPALKGLFTTPQVQRLTEAMNDPASLSFRDLRDARTWVRNAQRDDSLRQGASQADLQRLEGSLTQDINANAASIAGPQAARQLQQADTFYRLGSQRIQNSLQSFVGKGGNAPGESAYDMIVRAAGDKGGADTSKLQALKNSLKPSEWGDVAASAINRGAQGKDGTFSVNNFVTFMDNLSPQGKDLLFGKTDLRASLDNLVRVARMQKGVEQAANHSNTAVSAQALGTVAGLVNPHTAIPTLAGLTGMAGAGEMLTNPAAVRWLANLAKAEKTSPAAMSSAVGRLGSAARVSPALVPLFQESQKLLQAPARAAATTTNPPAGTP
jgi:hypothetical protein